MLGATIPGQRLDRVAAIVNDGVVLESAVEAQITQAIEFMKAAGRDVDQGERRQGQHPESQVTCPGIRHAPSRERERETILVCLLLPLARSQGVLLSWHKC